jgi:DNA-directed RNA polymerase specialized sigma24 family protein
MKNYKAHEELIETFEENTSELYQLAFLLTGNSDRSVEAFSKALDFDEAENPVFGGFMTTWARKLIVGEALGTIEKELRASKQRVARTAGDEAVGNAKWKRRAHIAREEFEEAVIAIDAFPRCAMLLTIFEGMSIEDAAVLLHADKSLTATAQRIGIVELTRCLAGNNGGRDPYQGMNPVPVLSLS